MIYVFQHEDYNRIIGVKAYSLQNAKRIISENYPEQKEKLHFDYDYSFTDEEGIIYDIENC